MEDVVLARIPLADADRTPRPAVRRALAARGLLRQFTARVSADPTARERHLETALMTLFRDTRANEVFDDLYRIASPALHSWILHLLAGRGDRGDPLELVQNTFVNIYRYAGGFDAGRGQSFRGWARTIAANVVRRSRMRRAADVTVPLPVGALEPTDRRAGPEHEALLNEERHGLRRAFGLLMLHYAAAWRELAPRDRLALELVEVRGWSYAEAGRLLRVGRSNMKMIMFRARKRLRARLAQVLEPVDESEVRRAG